MDGGVPASGVEDEHLGTLSSGRQHASGSGRTDGGAVGTPGSDAPRRGPRFDSDVCPGGYVWWYLDGLSDDGRFALTLIAFVGSVFSPYYAWSGRCDPVNHCAINIALYGKPGARWAMTERGRSRVTRSGTMFQVGQSSLRWRGDALEIDIDEVGAPIPRRIRGSIRVTPSGFIGRSFTLDPGGRHVWQPVAPRARIDVMLDRPGKSWSGTGYLDSNYGAEPLEAGFRNWTWSRAHLARDTVVFYDAFRNDGSDVSMAFRFDPGGHVRTVEPLPRTELSSTAWRISRNMRADADHTAAVRRTLEDTPFYARTHITAQIYGEQAECFHESLSLERFASPFVRAMLPFRMPRSSF